MTERINICDEGLENLTNAIVIQATEDYLDVKKICFVFDRQPTKSEQFILSDAIDFFHSDWYSMLCKIDGDRLLKMLDEKFEEWMKNEDEVNRFRNLHRRRNKKKESEEA